jgi:hypothetical protein
MRTVAIIFRSDFYGMGKSWLSLSFVNPEKLPAQRLLYDSEYRDENYKSPDATDHPDKGKFAFDLWHEVYGATLQESLPQVVAQLKAGKFSHNVLILDDGTTFQQDLYALLTDKAQCEKVLGILGILPAHQQFLAYRWKVGDASFYHVVKSVIAAFLRLLRSQGVDIMITSESKNEWGGTYGSRNAKIFGQTVKLWDPWLKMADAIFVLDRIQGDRRTGTAKLLAAPVATADTFNPKASLPGIAPTFRFTHWGVFWEMLDSTVPTDADFAKVAIPEAQDAEYSGLQTIDEAKQALVDYVIEKGLAEGVPAARAFLNTLSKAVDNLDPNDALNQYQQWLDAIDGAQ